MELTGDGKEVLVCSGIVLDLWGARGLRIDNWSDLNFVSWILMDFAAINRKLQPATTVYTHQNTSFHAPTFA